MKKKTTTKYNIKDTNDTIILYPKYIPQKIPDLIQTEINNPSFEADKEIDKSAVNQPQDINILLQKKIKR